MLTTPHAILFPAFALMGWTLCVLLLIPYRRFKAVFTGRVKVRDFQTGESSQVPLDVALPNRVYTNLLASPVLFYVLTLILYTSQTADVSCVVLAWLYWVLRMIHSLIYLIYNHVLHRFLAFALSSVVLVMLWGKALWHLAYLT